jgi:hypothetical protein
MVTFSLSAYRVTISLAGNNCDFSATTFRGKWFIIYTEEPSTRAAFVLGDMDAGMDRRGKRTNGRGGAGCEEIILFAGKFRLLPKCGR